ncbi:hypothetical protein [Streptomyces chryseus]
MLTFDPTTTSGNALASLFRTWCELRGADPDGDVNGGDMVDELSTQFEALGLDVGGPVSQVAMPSGHQVFTVFGLVCDHGGGLMVADVIPGEHAEAVVELETSEDHYGRWAGTFTAATADAAADLARQQVDGGEMDGLTDRTVVMPLRADLSTPTS